MNKKQSRAARHHEVPQLPTPPTVLIVVEGGVVQDVIATGPINYILKDFDNIKEGGEEFDGGTQPARIKIGSKFNKEIWADVGRAEASI